jgi:hypothetical protein
MKGVTRVTASLLAAAMTAGLGTTAVFAADDATTGSTGINIGNVDTTAPAPETTHTNTLTVSDKDGNLLASTDAYERNYYSFADRKVEEKPAAAVTVRQLNLAVGATKKLTAAVDADSAKAGNTVVWSYADVDKDGKINSSDVVKEQFTGDGVDGKNVTVTSTAPETDVVTLGSDGTLTATKPGKAIVYAVASDYVKENKDDKDKVTTITGEAQYVKFEINVVEPNGVTANFEGHDTVFVDSELEGIFNKAAEKVTEDDFTKVLEARTAAPTAAQLKYEGSQRVAHVATGDALNVEYDLTDVANGGHDADTNTVSVKTLNPRYITTSGLTATVTGSAPKDGVGLVYAEYAYDYADKAMTDLSKTSNYLFTVEHQGVKVYRVYNPNTGEHLYTIDEKEAKYLPTIGWISEGVGWYAPETSKAPVTRMFNPNNGGEHVYTTDAKEVAALEKAGWKNEGTKFYSATSKYFPLYRQYNPNAIANNHNYTGNIYERTVLVSLGWKDEGVKLYATELDADTIKAASDNVAREDD